jgi:hypothetical protein
MSYQISLTVGYPEIFDNKSVSIKYFDVEFTKKIRGDRNGEVEVVTRHASQIGKQLSFENRIKLESGIYYREKCAKGNLMMAGFCVFGMIHRILFDSFFM